MDIASEESDKVAAQGMRLANQCHWEREIVRVWLLLQERSIQFQMLRSLNHMRIRVLHACIIAFNASRSTLALQHSSSAAAYSPSL